MISLFQEQDDKALTASIEKGAKASIALLLVSSIVLGILFGNNISVLHQHVGCIISPVPLFFVLSAVLIAIAQRRKKYLSQKLDQVLKTIQEKVVFKDNFADLCRDLLIYLKCVIEQESTLPQSRTFTFRDKVYFVRDNTKEIRALVQGKQIGKGGFKTVSYAFDLLSRTFFAMKVTPKVFKIENEVRDLAYKQNAVREREIETLVCQHPSFKEPAFGWIEDAEEIIEFDTLYEGDLHTLKERGHTFTTQEKKDVVSCLLNALAFLEAQKVCHKDLTLDNIFYYHLGGKLQPKVADFNTSTTYQDKQKGVFPGGGRLLLMPPEVYLLTLSNMGSETSAEKFIDAILPKVDIWFAGIVLAKVFGLWDDAFEQRAPYKFLSKPMKIQEGVYKYTTNLIVQTTPEDNFRKFFNLGQDLTEDVVLETFTRVIKLNFNNSVITPEQSSKDPFIALIGKMLTYDYTMRPSPRVLMEEFQKIK